MNTMIKFYSSQIRAKKRIVTIAQEQGLFVVEINKYKYYFSTIGKVESFLWGYYEAMY